MADSRLLFAIMCSIQLTSINGILEDIVVKASCLKTESEYQSRLRVYRKTDTLGEIYGLDADRDPMTESCSTVNAGANTPESTGDGSDSTPLTFLARIDSTTSNPVTGSGCWQSRNVATGLYTWSYRVMDPRVTVPANVAGKPITFGEYSDYTFSCNFLTLSVNEYSADVTIDDGTTATQPTVEKADLLVVDPNDLTELTSLAEGMMVRLKAVMVPLSKDSTAVGVSPYACYVCGTDSCPSNMPRVKIINDMGCATADFTDAAGNPVSGFTGTDATTLTTGAFQLGGWAGQDFAIFTCKVEFCYQDDPAGYCKNRCGYFNGRKRRAARSARGSHNATGDKIKRSHQLTQSIIHVRNRGYRAPVDSKPIIPGMATNLVQAQYSRRCYRRVYFLATVTVLAVITVASIVTTIIACSKYRKIIHAD